MHSRLSEHILTELLAPARDPEVAVAAIDYGADAVYMGASKFGARHAAGNTVEDIARVTGYARRYGVRVYATLNTVLFDSELEQARRQALDLIDTGVDALIIQDMAYMEMGLTGVEFHASTQTFNASPEKVRFLEHAGFSRVILERNLTLEQIKAIRRATDVELEAFVHGAICVCHSGRCYMSRSTGPRSGNRGECSQPCRLTYDLLDSGGDKIMTAKHLLSVQDLDLSARIGELMDAGVTSFKIEGRLKEPNYVKNTVAAYRRRIDEEMAARTGFARASSGRSVHDFTPDLSKTFTRGRSEYFFGGKRRGVASFDTPKAVGESIGNVTSSGRGWFSIATSQKPQEPSSPGGQEFSPGDGICFFSGGELTGASVNRTEGGKISINKPLQIAPGTDIFRNYDHRFNTALDASRTRRVIDVSAEITALPDCITLSLTDESGHTATVSQAGPFDPAANPEKAEQTMRTQTAKSGDTIFAINDIRINHEGAVPFVPASTLNSLRRTGLEQLLETRISAAPRRTPAKPGPTIPYPSDSVDATENTTNRLARRFYERHGITHIEHGLDLRTDLHGCTVMRTPYCIRRETGRCTKGRPDQNTDLFLQRGAHTYLLRFDCSECMMEVIFQ